MLSKENLLVEDLGFTTSTPFKVQWNDGKKIARFKGESPIFGLARQTYSYENDEMFFNVRRGVQSSKQFPHFQNAETFFQTKNLQLNLQIHQTDLVMKTMFYNIHRVLKSRLSLKNLQISRTQKTSTKHSKNVRKVRTKYKKKTKKYKAQNIYSI